LKRLFPFLGAVLAAGLALAACDPAPTAAPTSTSTPVVPTSTLAQPDAHIGSMRTATPAQPAAQEFKSETGGFSVVMAAKLHEQMFPAATSGLTRPEIHSFSGALDASLYGVSYYTLPDLYVVEGAHTRATDPEGILQTADFYFFIDGLPGSPITLGADGYYRRELTYEHQGSRYKARLILVADLNNLNVDSNRVYAVFVSAPKDTFDEPAADDFLNSFTVLK
jgi:hypothetical protein